MSHGEEKDYEGVREGEGREMYCDVTGNEDLVTKETDETKYIKEERKKKRKAK